MLYDHPEIYDALFRPEDHVAHYAALAERYAGPVLELACGTGQITMPLARDGRQVVGLDASRAMLDAAKQRAAGAGAQVTWVKADMRGFELGTAFALIFIARNSLLHLTDTADIMSMLTAVRRHLLPGGAFAFDVFNPDVQLLARPAEERAPVMREPSAEHGELRVEATNDYDSATQVNRAMWYISTPNQQDRWVAPLHLRCIFPQELPLVLAARGFRLVSRAGDLAGGAFTSASRRQVCVCEAGTPR